jgi:hypothetical protein
MIDYLKQKYLFPLIMKRLAGRRPPVGKSIHYADAEDILFVFTLEGNDSVFPVRKLQQQIQGDGKNADFLSVLLDEANAPDVHLDKDMLRLSKKDFGFTGNIRNVDASRRLRKRYDYLIHVDLVPNPWAGLLVVRSQANCRIGKRNDGYEYLYDIMIDTGNRNGRDHFVEQLYHYIKAL